MKTRVMEGGHNIPEETIERRYYSGIKNLFEIYLPIVDKSIIFDNSEEEPELIGSKNFNKEIEIINTEKFDEIKSIYHEKR